MYNSLFHRIIHKKLHKVLSYFASHLWCLKIAKIVRILITKFGLPLDVKIMEIALYLLENLVFPLLVAFIVLYVEKCIDEK